MLNTQGRKILEFKKKNSSQNHVRDSFESQSSRKLDSFKDSIFIQEFF